MSGQDERRCEDFCEGYRGKGGVYMDNCSLDHNLGEDEYQHNDETGGDTDEPRIRCDNEHGGEDESSNRSKKNGRGGGRRGRGKGKRKCLSRGAAAPAPWIVDPHPRTEEGNIKDNDLGEEEFFPSPDIAVNEEGQHQPFGYISPENQPENQVLHYPGYHFVLDLVLACRHILSNSENEIDSIMNIFQFLKSTNATNDCSAESLRTVMAVDSLKNLAARCSQAEENIGVTHFVFMLNAIQLRCKVIRFIFPIFSLL